MASRCEPGVVVGVCATATPVIAAIPKIEIARRVVIEPS
jgi:hypothetical protein